MSRPYAHHGETIKRHEQAGHDIELWPDMWHCWDCDTLLDEGQEWGQR